MALPSKRASGARSYLGVMQRQRGRHLDDNDNDVSAALARISQTPDGDLLLSWIHQQTFGRSLPDTATEGALRALEARRSFATLIFNMLDRGLERNERPKQPGK